MLRISFFVLLVGIAGCDDQHELAVCNGDLVALNPTHWQPTQQDMEAFAKLCPATEAN